MGVHYTYRNVPFVVDDELDELVAGYRWSLDYAGYVRTNILLDKWTTMYLHNLVGGRPLPGYHCDHISRDKLDNRSSNLRLVLRGQNIANSNPHRSLPKGVYRRGDKYQASIRRDTKLRYLGVFNTVEEAVVSISSFKISYGF